MVEVSYLAKVNDFNNIYKKLVKVLLKFSKYGFTFSCTLKVLFWG